MDNDALLWGYAIIVAWLIGLTIYAMHTASALAPIRAAFGW